MPAYRSPGTLRELCEEVERAIAPLVSDLEIVFVDDGSGDGTWASIQTLAAERPEVRGITLSRNFGQHNALLAGIRAARRELVLTIDDDLQNPPNQVPLLFQALGDDVDLVYGTPKERPHGRARTAASRCTKRLMSFSFGSDVAAESSAFRLFRREVFEADRPVTDPFLSIDVMLSWATTKVSVVPVEFARRESGASGYSFGRLVRHALNMVTGYSTRPLRLVSVMGMIAALLGFALLVFVMLRWLLGGSDVAGFTFLAAAVTLFSGTQLLSLGIIGEYVGRMHFRSMGRPPYTIRATTDSDPVGPDPAS